MSVELIAIVVFALLFILLFIGAPIFICLGLAGFTGILMMRGTIGLYQAVAAIFSPLYSFIFVAVPLFMLMGEIISVTGIGSQIYDLMSKWFYRLPGGLAVATVFTCAVFGAMCGVSIAGVATIGIMAVPEMVKRGYKRNFAVGSVTAAGALAMLIPPSVPFIIYGEIASVSVGKLFIGGIIPGIVLAMMMSGYVFIRALKNPTLAPKLQIRVTWKERFAALKATIAPLILIAVVLGTIYTGVATPTESAAIGAAGALFIALTMYRGSVTAKSLWTIFYRTTRITGAIFIIVACALLFSRFLSLAKIPEAISTWVVGLGLPPLGTLFSVMILLVIVGMFIDVTGLILLTTPILLPVVVAVGYDPIFYGIMLIINTEMATITPPVGMSLFTIKTLFPEISMPEIIRGVLPYVAVDFACLTLFALLPELAMWLPNTMR